MPERIKLESYTVFAAARLLLLFFRIIPRALGRQILNALGSLFYCLAARYRHIAHVNLRIAFPQLSETQRRRIARRSFQNTAQNLLEVSRLPMLSRDNIASLVEYDEKSGLNNYEAAVKKGRPILYITGHFSSWELLPAAHAIYGYPLSFVTRPLDNIPLEAYLCRVRQLAGNVVISKKNSVRQILETLKASGPVGILMDQHTVVQEGVFAELFGLSVATTSGVAVFALRTDATVLPGYLTPLHKGRYSIKFLPPLDLLRSGDMNQDVLANTRLFNRVLEQIIREQPESWLWGHQRWKHLPPPNPADVYRMSPGELDAFLARRRGQAEPPE